MVKDEHEEQAAALVQEVGLQGDKVISMIDASRLEALIDVEDQRVREEQAHAALDSIAKTEITLTAFVAQQLRTANPAAVRAILDNKTYRTFIPSLADKITETARELAQKYGGALREFHEALGDIALGEFVVKEFVYQTEFDSMHKNELYKIWYKTRIVCTHTADVSKVTIKIREYKKKIQKDQRGEPTGFYDAEESGDYGVISLRYQRKEKGQEEARIAIESPQWLANILKVEKGKAWWRSKKLPDRLVYEAAPKLEKFFARYQVLSTTNKNPQVLSFVSSILQDALKHMSRYRRNTEEARTRFLP